MGRKSTIKRLPADVRKHLEKRLREDQLTLDELIADLQATFPDVEAPSRSSLHRYGASFAELTGRMREIETAAGALVDELGDGIGDKAGALLTQAVTTLLTHTALDAQTADKALTIKEVSELARGAKAAMDARTSSLKERQQIERIAREKLQAEQAEKLKTLTREGGISSETAAMLRKQILGMA